MYFNNILQRFRNIGYIVGMSTTIDSGSSSSAYSFQILENVSIIEVMLASNRYSIFILASSFYVYPYRLHIRNEFLADPSPKMRWLPLRIFGYAHRHLKFQHLNIWNQKKLTTIRKRWLSPFDYIANSIKIIYMQRSLCFLHLFLNFIFNSLRPVFCLVPARKWYPKVAKHASLTRVLF